MQNVSQESSTDNPKIDKVTVQHDIGNSSSTPQSTSNSSPAKSETETYSEHRRYMSETSESEEDSVSEVESFMIDQEFEDDPHQVEAAKFLLNPDEDRAVDPETQARLEQLLQAAGIGQLSSKDGKHLGDPEVLRRLTSSVSCALDEAAAALTRMRADNPRAAASQPPATSAAPAATTEKTSLVEACTDGDVGTVRKLLTEGRSVHETSEEGESLLSLACSAGYFELAQVLLAMHANVEDRGIKGECTPLMEAASAGHLDIVRLLVAHGADVNAQSTSGNTPLMYGCAGGHTEVVKYLLENGANVEDHNENGHTPLMEAASAGHVGLAKILLEHGAGINTHSNEFKESALTLACYKGHLDMVRFLLEAGADQEHKTDEMHTALMEASMDGHVEVARLLLDSGAQVNMPTDSFESPLTLAACGGHVDLAMLLIERGANIEEVNDEGYTPLMEAAREGHEEMVHLLLGQGANINAQTDETQETALTLACCGGFTEVADILLKGGAFIELGASTPLMEAAQEGHLELVRFLLENGAHVRAQTQTGDTALTYACENGHTDVADLLLQYGADLEHESEGGRTPLMKACRAGHLCTVQFLISKGADVRRQTTNNDHTPLSLACAGGHLPVVELLLAHNADPNHKLKDNSTMLIEAAKGGHTNVVQLLLDYPHSMVLSQQQHQQPPTTATNLSMLPGQVGSRESPLPPGTLPPNLPSQHVNFFQQPQAVVLQEVPDAVRIVHQEDTNNPPIDLNSKQQIQSSASRASEQPKVSSSRKNLPKSRSTGAVFDSNLTSAEAQQVRTQPLNDFEGEVFSANAAMDFLNKEDTIIDFIKNRKKTYTISSDEGSTQKQQILEELHRVERELHGKTQAHNHVFQYAISQEQCPSSTATTLPHMLNIDIAMQQQKQQGLGTGMMTSGTIFPGQNLQVHNAFYTGGVTTTCLPPTSTPKLSGDGTQQAFIQQPNQQQQTAQQQPTAQYYFAPLPAASSVSLSTVSTNANTTAPIAGQVITAVTPNQPIKFQSVTSHSEVSQNTAISDRPKAKPVSKKEGKNIRKQQQQAQQLQAQQQQVMLQQQAQPQTFQPSLYTPQPTQIFSQLQLTQPQQLQVQTQQFQQQVDFRTIANDEALNQELHDMFVLKNENHDNLLTASILQQFHTAAKPALKAGFVDSPQKSRLELYDHTDDCNKVTKLELSDQDFTTVDDVVQTLESFNTTEVNEQSMSQHNLQVQPYPSALDESMIAQLAAQQDLPTQTDSSRVEYFAVPTNGTQVPVHALYPYEQYLAGFHLGCSLMQQKLASASETLTTTTVVPTSVGNLPGTSTQQFITQQQQPTVCTVAQPSCNHVATAPHCQMSCGQHPQLAPQQQQQQPSTHQVQTATQTQQATQTVNGDTKKISKGNGDGKGYSNKKNRVLRHQNHQNFQQNQNYQIDHNSAITQYSGANQQQCPNAPCIEVDSETESNHDTALTLACAGGHEELVELLISRGADIEHRDKKGFTPLILAATAGHEKVVEILLNHSAEIEAQSERTKDTPLSLACSGGRYEVVELLLTRGANKEHRNVSDYTPLSLAASGGYVNIIKLLLSHGAEINSRTGSKLGISPLMLAAMNGHTAAVKLLLDMGSDINAQIETNRNTALTLACFQGRHEVVSLLLDRKANVEHRAKTGLTPLMEAASGGYVEVGRVLLDKGADVNATPVPSSRDTALTIAADKGHVRFVELLLCRGAQVEVKNKKGNSPLWLAANGGHLPVVELLYNVNADIDSQDNRKVSCLMAAFRKGHVKVVKWMVHHVTQFPSDQEMMRYNATVSDKELLEKCQECVKIIRAAKETQAAKANKNASILLEELESEKTREESKRLAAARRRERKKKKKLEKKEERRKLLEENKKNENYDEKPEKQECIEEEKNEEDENVPEANPTIRDSNDKEEGDSGIDANSQGSCSSADLKSKEKRKDKKKKKNNTLTKTNESHVRSKAGSSKSTDNPESPKSDKNHDNKNKHNFCLRKPLVFESTKSPADRDDFEATGNEVYVSNKKLKQNFEETSPQSNKSSTSPKQSSKRDEGWKEVIRKSSVQAVSTSESGVKKVSVPLNAISRVIGRGGSNINAIRGATGAHIEVEKQSKGQGERIITIKGSAEATKQAHNLITALIKDPDVDILTMLPKTTKTISSATTLWDKTQIGTKKIVGKLAVVTPSNSSVASTHQKITQAAAPSVAQVGRFPTTSAVKPRGTTPVVSSRVTAPRLVAQAEKNAAAAQAQSNSIRMVISHPTSTSSRPAPAMKVITSMANQTFAAKLTETTSGQLIVNTNHTVTTKNRNLGPPQSTMGPVSPQSVPHSTATTQSSPNRNNRPAPTASAPPNMQHFQSPGKIQPPIFGSSSSHINAPTTMPSVSESNSSTVTLRSSTPNIIQNTSIQPNQEDPLNIQTPSEYSLFYNTDWSKREQESQKPINFAAVTGGSNSQSVVQHKFIDQEPPPQVDASKAPGYRGGAVCSPVSSKTSSSSTTPPNISANNSFQSYQEPPKPQNTLPPIGSNIVHRQPLSQPPSKSDMNIQELMKTTNMLSLSSDTHMRPTNYNSIQNLSFSQSQPQVNIQQSASMSRLNPKAPEYSSYSGMQQNKSTPHLYNNGYQMNSMNNIYTSKQPMDNYPQPRTSMGVSQQQNKMWMHMPSFSAQQSEHLISGFAGMTLHNIAKFTGNEVLDASGELGIVNNSPNMSPNLPPAHHLHQDLYMEDRKPPQPIGTGRRTFNTSLENWRSNEKIEKWSQCGNQSDFIIRNSYGEDPYPDYSRTMPQLDTPHNYMNGPTYYNQPPMNAVRNDFIPDISKLENMAWSDNPPRQMAELQEKQHGWINKWNQ